MGGMIVVMPSAETLHDAQLHPSVGHRCMVGGPFKCHLSLHVAPQVGHTCVQAATPANMVECYIGPATLGL